MSALKKTNIRHRMSRPVPSRCYAQLTTGGGTDEHGFLVGAVVDIVDSQGQIVLHNVEPKLAQYLCELINEDFDRDLEG